MIIDLKRSIELRRLFDPLLHSSLDDLVLRQSQRRAHLSVQNGLNEGWTVHSGLKPIQLYIGVEGKAWVEEKNKLEVGWNWRRYRDLWVLGAEGWPLWAEVAEVHSLRPCSYLPSFIGLRKSFLDSQNTYLKATQKNVLGRGGWGSQPPSSNGLTPGLHP